MLYLDGGSLEGGGQLLRTAVCLSALTKRNLRLEKIRRSRKGKTGLKHQHLACVDWLVEASCARIQGASLGSTSLHVRPDARPSFLPPCYRPVQTDHGQIIYSTSIDVGSSGSICLVLQAVLPFILFTPIGPRHCQPHSPPTVDLKITGGTNVSMSPSIDYVMHVLVPNLQLVGFPHMKTDLHSRGWSDHKSDSGSATFRITPLRHGASSPAFSFVVPSDNADGSSGPRLVHLAAKILGPTNLWPHLIDSFESHVQATVPIPSDTDMKNFASTTTEDSGSNSRLYLLIIATVLSSTSLSTEKREFKLGADRLFAVSSSHKPESLVDEVVRSVLDDIMRQVNRGDLLDDHMKDQLVIFQALAAGVSWLPRVEGNRATSAESGRSVYAEGEESDVRNRQGEQKRKGKKSTGRSKTALDLHQKTVEWVACRMLGGDGVEFRDDGSCRGTGFVCGRAAVDQPGIQDGIEELTVDDLGPD